MLAITIERPALTIAQDLFRKIGPVQDVRMLFDRQDRSIGTAFVTYRRFADAEAAVREYDNANAYGQPVRVKLAAPSQPARNPFDYAERPGRSLFDRIEAPGDESRRNGGGRRRARSASPGRLAPDDSDRYVPGTRSRDSRSSLPRRGGGARETGRRPGARREDSGARGGRGRGGEGRQTNNARPRKTAEELDAEMNDYWTGRGAASAAAQNQNGAAREPQIATVQNGENPGAATTSAVNADDDIDLMIE